MVSASNVNNFIGIINLKFFEFTLRRIIWEGKILGGSNVEAFA
jgi:hypothetical protein